VAIAAAFHDLCVFDGLKYLEPSIEEAARYLRAAAPSPAPGTGVQGWHSPATHRPRLTRRPTGSLWSLRRCPFRLWVSHKSAPTAVCCRFLQRLTDVRERPTLIPPRAEAAGVTSAISLAISPTPSTYATPSPGSERAAASERMGCREQLAATPYASTQARAPVCGLSGAGPACGLAEPASADHSDGPGTARPSSGTQTVLRTRPSGPRMATVGHRVRVTALSLCTDPVHGRFDHLLDRRARASRYDDLDQLKDHRLTRTVVCAVRRKPRRREPAGLCRDPCGLAQFPCERVRLIRRRTDVL
jgi:hypothetical protein